MFKFISRYRDQSDFMLDNPREAAKLLVVEHGRYRLKDDGTLTVGYEPATKRELALFRKWQTDEHRRQIDEMKADPVRYPPEFYEVTDAPRNLATSPKDRLRKAYLREASVEVAALLERAFDQEDLFGDRFDAHAFFEENSAQGAGLCYRAYRIELATPVRA